MITRFSDGVTRIVQTLLWLGLLLLILDVALQGLTRNVLQMSLIWTGDVAQLLFVWLVFLGAAVGLRRGAHYTVDVLPTGIPVLKAITELVGIAATAVVIYVLLWHGWRLAGIRSTGLVQSLGISRLWMFLPIPVSGALMLLYLVEKLAADIAALGRRSRA